MSDQDERDELTRRVIFSLVVPAARLAARKRVPLKEVTGFMRLAIFRQLRNSGANLKEIGQALGTSERTAKRLGAALRENFFAPEAEHDLGRRIEFMLWATPMTAPRIAQVLDGVDQGEVRSALDALIEQGRARHLEERPGYYSARSADGTRLARDSKVARIGALNSLLHNVANAVIGRFFEAEERAFARTLAFRVRAEDLCELRQMYEEQIWERLRALEQRVGDDDDAVEMQLSVCWAPFELEDP